MSPERLAVATTVHPASLPYLGDFARSVAAQDDTDFDLWVTLDDVDVADVEDALVPVGRARLRTAPPGATPAGHRSELLTLLCQRYPAVVLVDSDDVLAAGRVGSARRALELADVQACAMALVDANGRALDLTFTTATPDDWLELSTRMNVVGFGNAAYRSATLQACLPLPADAVLVDWWVITRALALGARLVFDREPLVAYRQHGRSSARVIGPFAHDDLARGTERVLGHFRRTLDHARGYPEAAVTAIEAARDEIERFADVVVRRGAHAEDYLQALNADRQVFRWWEWIADRRYRTLWTR